MTKHAGFHAQPAMPPLAKAEQIHLTEADIDRFKAEGAVELPSLEPGEREIAWVSKVGTPHRLDGPASIIIQDMVITKKYWMRQGKEHRRDGPAIIVYHANGMVAEEIWCTHGQRHRHEQPAIVHYFENGAREQEIWVRKDQLHRKNGPARRVFWPNGAVAREVWYYEGCNRRPMGPAIVTYWPTGRLHCEFYGLDDGNIESFELSYQEDGVTIASQSWVTDDYLHREGFPAVIMCDENGLITDGEWYEDGAEAQVSGHRKMRWKMQFKGEPIACDWPEVVKKSKARLTNRKSRNIRQ